MSTSFRPSLLCVLRPPSANGIGLGSGSGSGSGPNVSVASAAISNALLSRRLPNKDLETISPSFFSAPVYTSRFGSLPLSVRSWTVITSSTPGISESRLYTASVKVSFPPVSISDSSNPPASSIGASRSSGDVSDLNGSSPRAMSGGVSSSYAGAPSFPSVERKPPSTFSPTAPMPLYASCGDSDTSVCDSSCRSKSLAVTSRGKNGLSPRARADKLGFSSCLRSFGNTSGDSVGVSTPGKSKPDGFDFHR